MKIASGPAPFPSLVRRSASPEAEAAPADIPPEAFVKCPHLRKQAKEARPLAYKHDYEGTKPANPPLARVTPEQWENAKHYDILIAGAGIGGLYTAWKLQGCDGSASERPKIAMFERTAHLGGRLHTAKVAGVAHPMDVGAMRYVPAENPLLQSLTDRFSIPTQKFVVAGAANLNYFRGERSTQAEGPGVLPYKLRPEEQGKSPEELLRKAFSAVIPDFEKLSREDLEKAVGEARVGGVPLTQLGLQNVLARSLSREAIQMITDTEGYQSDLQNWDAGQAMLELAPGLRGEVEYRVPKEGMNAFYEALQTDLSRTPTEIRMGKTLRQVDYDADKKQFKLLVDDVPFTADKVVLNMPKVPLAELVGNSPFLQHTPLAEGLEKVEANPLTRIFATYEKPWWTEMGIQGGRSVTDLNLGQVYYYGNGEQSGPIAPRPYLEVYNDGTKSEFWEGLQNPGDPGVSVRLNAQPQLAEELQKELEEMHGRELPKPTGLLYKRWADPFFGAGWHTWNPGTKPSESAETMIAPLPGLPLYVTGEAFSTNQGWVEGALETSEKVVAKIKNE